LTVPASTEAPFQNIILIPSSLLHLFRLGEVARMILILPFLCLLSLRWVLAAPPHIWFPDYFETDPKFKADYPTWKDVVDQAFQDAITLARVVVLTGSSCDPVRLWRETAFA